MQSNVNITSQKLFYSLTQSMYNVIRRYFTHLAAIKIRSSSLTPINHIITQVPDITIEDQLHVKFLKQEYWGFDQLCHSSLEPKYMK